MPKENTNRFNKFVICINRDTWKMQGGGENMGTGYNSSRYINRPFGIRNKADVKSEVNYLAS